MNLNSNYSYPQPYTIDNAHEWVYPVHCEIELTLAEFTSYFTNLGDIQAFHAHDTWVLRLGSFQTLSIQFDCSIEDAVEIEHMRQMWVAMEWNQGYDDDKLWNMPASPRDIVNPIPSVGEMQDDIDYSNDKQHADYDVTPEQMDDENQIAF